MAATKSKNKKWNPNIRQKRRVFHKYLEENCPPLQWEQSLAWKHCLTVESGGVFPHLAKRITFFPSSYCFCSRFFPEKSVSLTLKWTNYWQSFSQNIWRQKRTNGRSCCSQDTLTSSMISLLGRRQTPFYLEKQDFKTKRHLKSIERKNEALICKW